jgi:hypothetical protein
MIVNFRMGHTRLNRASILSEIDLTIITFLSILSQISAEIHRCKLPTGKMKLISVSYETRRMHIRTDSKAMHLSTTGNKKLVVFSSGFICKCGKKSIIIHEVLLYQPGS